MRPSELKEGESITRRRGKIHFVFYREYGQLNAGIGPPEPPYPSPEFDRHGTAIRMEREYDEAFVNVYLKTEEEIDAFHAAIIDRTEAV